MVDLGEHQRVSDIRTFVQHASEKEFVETVEQITGRSLRAFVSGTDTEHDVSSEVFYLHPDRPGSAGDTKPCTSSKAKTPVSM